MSGIAQHAPAHLRMTARKIMQPKDSTKMVSSKIMWMDMMWQELMRMKEKLLKLGEKKWYFWQICNQGSAVQRIHQFSIGIILDRCHRHKHQAHSYKQVKEYLLVAPNSQVMHPYPHWYHL